MSQDEQLQSVAGILTSIILALIFIILHLLFLWLVAIPYVDNLVNAIWLLLFAGGLHDCLNKHKAGRYTSGLGYRMLSQTLGLHLLLLLVAFSTPWYNAFVMKYGDPYTLILLPLAIPLGFLADRFLGASD